MKAVGSSTAHRCVSVRDGEGGTKCLSIPHYRELCISSVKHSHVKCGRESEGTVVLLTEKHASHIYPEQKGTSHVWIKLKKELTSSDLHIYLCAIYMTPLSNTTIRNDDP